MALTEQYFESRELASRTAAARLADALSRDLQDREEATLIVSGGSSPGDCFRELSGIDLPWNRTHILMSDDRYVDRDHSASNEGMICRELLTGHARAATVVSMYQPDVPVDERCETLEAELINLPRPAAAGLLGMGEDGHFASLFPDFDQLDVGLDPNYERACLPVQTVASPYSRITLTLQYLLNTKELLLLFFGENKRAVFEQALNPKSALPVARLLQQEQTPVHTIWAL
jgi:6-phosphogluconolactonase